jgi:hypothetical protein
MASRRKRGPMALRLQLWLDLPLSKQVCDMERRRQFWDLLKFRAGPGVLDQRPLTARSGRPELVTYSA